MKLCQFDVRAHKNMISTQKALLKVWSINHEDDIDKSTDLSRPLMYIDQFRFRNAGDNQFRLRPHVDCDMAGVYGDPLFSRHCYKVLKKFWLDTHDDVAWQFLLIPN